MLARIPFRVVRIGRTALIPSFITHAVRTYTINVNVNLDPLIKESERVQITSTNTENGQMQSFTGINHTTVVRPGEDTISDGERSLLVLSNLEVQQLLEQRQLPELAQFVLDYKLTGTNLAYGIESVQDLTSMGLNVIQARTLLRLVREWKVNGILENVVSVKESSPPESISIAQLEELLLQQLSPAIGDDHAPALSDALDLADETNTKNDAPSMVNRRPEIELHTGLDAAFINARWGSNKQAALDLIIQSAETEPLAQAYLSTLYAKGCFNMQPNYANAMHYAKLALPWLLEHASSGNPFAQFNLALCYHDGRGVRQDFKKATQLYELASLQGHEGAAINLAVCYEAGTGVEQDTTLATEYYQFFAEMGHPHAIFCLGYCHQQGIGVPQNDIEAVVYFREAAKRGHSEAMCQLAMCLLHGRGVRKDVLEAERCLTQAAEEGHGDAWRILNNRAG